MYADGVCGEMDFTPDDIKAGKHIEFIKFLMKQNCEIRLWTDGYCYVVEYLQQCRTDSGDHFVLNSELEENNNG